MPDDFASSLGSMSREQLRALLSEMGNRVNQDWATGSVNGPGNEYTSNAFGLTGWHGVGSADQFRETVGQGSLVGRILNYKKGKAKKAERAAAEEAMRAERARQKQIMQERMNQVQQQIKTLDLRDKVNQQFQDLNLEGLFDRIAKQGLDQNVLGITQQHEDIANKTGFDAVSRGLGGSSYDATRIGDIQASQDQAIAQAAAQANQQKTAMVQNADQQRRGLLDSISGANPGEDARLTGDLQNIRNQADQASTTSAIQQAGIQNNQNAANGYSQALGGLLHSYANLYRQG